MTIDLFLASRVARREGWAGGLRGEETGGDEVGIVGERTVDARYDSVRFLCSDSFMFSFLEVMEMDWIVVL